MSDESNTLANSFAELTVSARATAHEYVRSVLRRAILNGDLTTGQRLVQTELAANLDVSTTPVREALRDLATEGLVQFDPHRGAIVTELTTQELLDIYDIRLVLEPLAMRQAVPRVTDDLIAVLHRTHQKMLEEPHSGEWVDRNRVFHMAVYETAASARLASIIRNLQDASMMYVSASLLHHPSLRQQANQEHAAILDALERRDADAAVATITEHLETSRNAIT
jgi:DNA-binding GntR family transcriptional regulator